MNDKASFDIKSRPLSPHLSIYKPQITSILSILHRLTGAYLYFGLMLMVWWIIIAVYSSFNPHLASWTFFTKNVIGKLFLLGWSFSLFYHLLNGIRHLFWDIGLGFKLKTVTWSGVLVIVGSVALTIISWGIVYN